jgi:hypothetical protein
VNDGIGKRDCRIYGVTLEGSVKCWFLLDLNVDVESKDSLLDSSESLSASLSESLLLVSKVSYLLFFADFVRIFGCFLFGGGGDLKRGGSTSIGLKCCVGFQIFD